MHHQVGVRDAGVDFFHARNGQHIACGWAGEFVRAVAGANGNGQGVELRGLHKLGGFFRIGQHLAVIELAHGAHAVFFTGFAGFQRTQAAQLTLDRGTDAVCHGHHFLGHAHVVVKVGGGFAVFTQRAVHHHRAKTQVERALANGGRGAVVLVHDQRNVRIGLAGGGNQVFDEALACVLARASAGLQDDRRTDLIGRCHHSLHLLQVVDVESGDAVAVLCGMVEQFAHRDEGHGRSPFEGG